MDNPPELRWKRHIIVTHLSQLEYEISDQLQNCLSQIPSIIILVLPSSMQSTHTPTNGIPEKKEKEEKIMMEYRILCSCFSIRGDRVWSQKVCPVEKMGEQDEVGINNEMVIIIIFIISLQFNFFLVI